MKLKDFFLLKRKFDKEITNKILKEIKCYPSLLNDTIFSKFSNEYPKYCNLSRKHPANKIIKNFVEKDLISKLINETGQKFWVNKFVEIHSYFEADNSLSLHQDNYGWNITEGLAFSSLIYLGNNTSCFPLAFYPSYGKKYLKHTYSEVKGYSSQIENQKQLDETKIICPVYEPGDVTFHSHLLPHGPNMNYKGSSYGDVFLRIVFFSDDLKQNKDLIKENQKRILANRKP